MGTSLSMREGSAFRCYTLQAYGCTSDAIILNSGSTLIAESEIQCYRSGGIGIAAYGGSKVIANSITAGFYTTKSILSKTGSLISANSGNLRKVIGVDTSTDAAVESGGTIILGAAVTGGVSQTANTITANGIIFR